MISGLTRRLVAAAANVTGRQFRVLAASSTIATSAIIAAALTGGDLGPWEDLLAQAYGDSGALTASGGDSPFKYPEAPSTGAAPAGGPSGPAGQAAGETASGFGPPPSSPPPPPPPASEPPPPSSQLGRVKHVFVISLSSPGYEQSFGDQSQMPYLASTLRPAGELLSNYSLLTQKALPNHLAMISGQPPNDQTSENCPTYSEFPSDATVGGDGIVAGNGCVFPVQALTLADQIASGSLKWRAYMESMADANGQPKGCVHPGSGEADQPAQGGYATTHNPFAYFHSLLDLGSCSLNDVPLDRLDADLGSLTATPNYSFISPNLCHAGEPAQCPDGEPGGAAAADAFLEHWVPLIRESPAYKKDGLLIITFGDTHAPDGAEEPLRAGTLLLSKFVAPGSTRTEPHDPYSLLRSTEDLFSAEPLGNAAASSVQSFGPELLGTSG